MKKKRRNISLLIIEIIKEKIEKFDSIKKDNR